MTPAGSLKGKLQAKTEAKPDVGPHDLKDSGTRLHIARRMDRREHIQRRVKEQPRLRDREVERSTHAYREEGRGGRDGSDSIREHKDPRLTDTTTFEPSEVPAKKECAHDALEADAGIRGDGLRAKRRVTMCLDVEGEVTVADAKLEGEADRSHATGDQFGRDRSTETQRDRPIRFFRHTLGWRRTAVGMMSYRPTPGRVGIVEFDGPPADREAPVTAAEVEQSLRRVSGADVRVTALRSATRFTDNTRQASSYRQGRVLLAGDAAHVHSPFGGQGLNLGLLEAVNLGWKLCATVQGRAPDSLLDTYTTERHPVAARVLDNTRAQLALMRPDPQTTAMRQIVADLLTTNPDVNRHFGEMISGVTTRYDLGDDDPLVGRLVADLDLTIDGVVTRLFSRMRDGCGLIVDGDGMASEEGAAWASRVRVMKAPGARSMLVRPDGCIAWAGRAGGLRPALERWFSAP
jgi:hypothetical protein